MTRIKLIFLALIIGLTGLWLAADPVFFQPVQFNQLRNSFINYTGIIAMGVMSVSMMLALRSVAVEPYVGGLDKSYRLHKWLGVAGLVMAIAHWLWIEGPGWLVALGLKTRPARGAAPRTTVQGAALLRMLKGPAQSVGQWCFYATVILVVLALLKWF